MTGFSWPFLGLPCGCNKMTGAGVFSRLHGDGRSLRRAPCSRVVLQDPPYGFSLAGQPELLTWKPQKTGSRNRWSFLMLSLKLAIFYYVTSFCHMLWVKPVQPDCRASTPQQGSGLHGQGGKEFTGATCGVT